ncbi:MAG: radical SAM protein [Prevotella sp.]|nr:radical SAM protein [Prevotella sp.]
MSINYASPIFGPVKSRRLGVSLGINLLPGDGKVCTFDCIYCECGLNKDHRPKSKMPTREEVCRGLEKKLSEMQAAGEAPDVLTFAGNGEPTCHPDFAAIIDDTLRLRDKYFPKARVSVLSNATQLHREDVREALRRVDNNCLKLDTVSSTYINKVDRPTGKYDVKEVIEYMKLFRGQAVVQSMFMKGDGVDNTSEEFVEPWLKTILEIAPREVMIYTIDRDTPVGGLEKATPEELNSIRDRVIAAGIPCSASY